MRQYSLQDAEYRKTVDLRSYATLIEDTIHSVAPLTNVNVYVDHYTIDPVPPKGDLIKIGRILAKSEYLGQYCITRPLLFKGEESYENDSNDQNVKTEQEQKNKKLPKKKGRCR